MKVRLTLIKDLKIALKDLEKYVKTPDFLRKGRKFTNFSLLPREAWANWLVCVFGNSQTGGNLTFGEDPENGDGIILDSKNREKYVLTEHVFITDLDQGNASEVIVNRIFSKFRKGKEYGKGRTLIVFCEMKGTVFPSDVRRAIYKQNTFDNIYLIVLESSESDGYSYFITPLITNSPHLTLHRIRINDEFKEWSVELIEIYKNTRGFN